MAKNENRVLVSLKCTECKEANYTVSKNKKNIKQDVNYPCKLQHLRKRVLKIKQTFHFTTITDRANPEGL